MYSLKPIITSLLKQLIFLFFAYQISRVLFVVFNHTYFSNLSVTELISFCFYGLRFDAFSIAACNLLYVILFILPFKFHYNKYYQLFLKSFFIITNSIFLSLNFIDIAYFPYTQKRITYDVGGMIFGGQSDILKLIPHFIKDYWYVILLFVAIIYLTYKYLNKVYSKNNPQKIEITFKTIIISIFAFLIFSGLGVLGIRGGLQRIPIVLLDAAAYASPKYIPIVINTPFSFLKSIELNEIKNVHYYDDEKLKEIFNPIHKPDTGEFKKINICVIILESFSKEYTGISNRKSYTPFLDSLMKVSTVFTNAIANAKTSIDGIPAIISGIPCFLEDKYLNSRYSNNQIESLPSLLKEKGYQSTFFHGGTNGTMNFDSYAKIAGYDSYYGRKEYNNEKDYDGQWGIFDEPFLKQMVKEINLYNEPFFVSVFTLSSHNPYTIPNQYKGKFPKGTLEIHETIGYTDNALRLFFNDAKKQKWFKNTLFVLAADHTGISDDPFYSSNIGQHSIPIVLYKHGQIPETRNYMVQQIDIMPTILDYLNYDKPFYALGKSMLQKNNQPIIYYTSPNYNIVKDSIIYDVINAKITSRYNYQVDSAQQKNNLQLENGNSTEEFFKAYIQTYTNDLINNKTYYHEKK
jgi:phosphoglycerol transferase MdoB-like AlkP superfamily enzyme